MHDTNVQQQQMPSAVQIIMNKYDAILLVLLLVLCCVCTGFLFNVDDIVRFV